jgi:hypothetical protein
LLYFYFVQFECTAACAKPPGRGVGEKDAIYKGRVRFPFIKGGGYKLIRPAAANTRLVTNNTNPSVLATKNLCQVRSCGSTPLRRHHRVFVAHRFSRSHCQTAVDTAAPMAGTGDVHVEIDWPINSDAQRPLHR